MTDTRYYPTEHFASGRDAEAAAMAQEWCDGTIEHPDGGSSFVCRKFHLRKEAEELEPGDRRFLAQQVGVIVHVDREGRGKVDYYTSRDALERDWEALEEQAEE